MVTARDPSPRSGWASPWSRRSGPPAPGNRPHRERRNRRPSSNTSMPPSPDVTAPDPDPDRSGGPPRVMVVAPPWFEVPPARYGGIERMCFDLVEGLVDEGHEVTLVATGSNHTRAQFV